MRSAIVKKSLFIAISLSLSAGIQAQQTSSDSLEEIVVRVQKRPTYAYSSIDESMVKQQSSITSILAVIDNLPGVLVNEGDVFGSDDWSTTISMRGFQTSLDEQQIGITIDGIPNGNSNYGGGAKANRFIDTMNLGGVLVSQGTADIASHSNEALGGTLDFLTQDPELEQRLRMSATVGDYDARKFYARYDSGNFMGNNRAWLSLSTSDNKTWIEETGESNRDHIAAKIVSELETLKLTGYIAWDDIHEDNYERVTPEEFIQNPDWDRLTGDWTGVPHIDQLYRRGWSTLRENLLAYGRAEFPIGPVELNFAGYYHDNNGRGDWLPPYVVNVTDDGVGNGNSELAMNPDTVLGGAPLGRLTFVDPSGMALTPTPGCTSSLTFPYGGAGPEYDADCFAANAVPVGSYRHTNYWKERMGITGDFDWVHEFSNFTNSLRGGLWYEDYHRKETRTWQKVIDSTAGFQFENVPYWRQYDREFPIETLMYYLEDSIEAGVLTARVGIKQFRADLERQDNFQGGITTASVSSDSDLLLSGGLVARMPAVEGLEIFAGYAENFAAIKDEVLESDGSTLAQIEPETAENIDVGIRYESDRLRGSLTYYNIDFNNRITFIPPGTTSGIDYLIGTNGSYINVGGVESDGFEVALSYRLTDQIRGYLSYTNNNSTYLGTGDPDLDTTVGITPGNTVFGSAENMFVFSADWEMDQYGAGFSSKWVGKRWLDPANTYRLEDYVLTDVYVGVNVGDLTDWVQGINLQLVVNNLFDKRYLGGVAGGWGGWIGGGRTAALNLTGDF